MKSFLLPLALFSAAAVACPGEGTKDARAPADKMAVAKTASSTTVATQSVTKVSAKVQAEKVKPAPK